MRIHRSGVILRSLLLLEIPQSTFLKVPRIAKDRRVRLAANRKQLPLGTHQLLVNEVASKVFSSNLLRGFEGLENEK